MATAKETLALSANVAGPREGAGGRGRWREDAPDDGDAEGAADLARQVVEGDPTPCCEAGSALVMAVVGGQAAPVPTPIGVDPPPSRRIGQPVDHLDVERDGAAGPPISSPA
jgi:hypothetical protein